MLLKRMQKILLNNFIDELNNSNRLEYSKSILNASIGITAIDNDNKEG